MERIAERQLLRGRRADAIKVLIEATARLGGTKKRPERIRLLGRVRTIEPWHFAGGMALARELRAAKQRDEARLLLDGLAERNEGAKLRKVRWALFSMSPTPAALWRWLRAAVAGR